MIALLICKGKARLGIVQLSSKWILFVFFLNKRRRSAFPEILNGCIKERRRIADYTKKKEKSVLRDEVECWPVYVQIYCGEPM